LHRGVGQQRIKSARPTREAKQINLQTAAKDWIGKGGNANRSPRRGGGRTHHHCGEDFITIPCRDWPRWPMKRAWTASTPSLLGTPPNRSIGAATLRGGARRRSKAQSGGSLFPNPGSGHLGFPLRSRASSPSSSDREGGWCPHGRMAIAAAAAEGCGFGRDDTGGGGGEQEDVLATVGRPRPLFCFVLFCCSLSLVASI